MENLVSTLREIFEIDEIDVSKKFADFDEWDSLSSLTLIAILDSDYGISISNKELLEFISISDFCKYVLLNAK
jgi:acyl carrier protein